VNYTIWVVLHFLLYAVYICQKSLNFTYTFKCYQQNCSCLHFTWTTLYIHQCRLNSLRKRDKHLPMLLCGLCNQVYMSTFGLNTAQCPFLTYPFIPFNADVLYGLNSIPFNVIRAKGKWHN